MPRRFASSGRARVVSLVLALVLLLIAAAGLAFWWWSLRSLTDPIDANPVSTTATVVSSPPCTEGGLTTVRLSGADAGSLSTLDGCGFTVGERLAVDYLANHPESVRLTGTTRAGESPVTTKVVPIVILAAGLAAVALLGFAAVGRRSGSTATGGTGRSRRRGAGESAVTMAELRARMGLVSPAASPGAASPDAASPDAASPGAASPPETDAASQDEAAFPAERAPGDGAGPEEGSGPDRLAE